MKNPNELQQQLIKANEKCQAGTLTVKAYKHIERQVAREIKEYHRRQYISAMGVKQ